MARAALREPARIGFTFDLNLSDNLERALFLAGTYEPEFMAFLEAEVQPGDVYIDVGGHIGLDALVAARKLSGRGRVFCFEPSPDSAEEIPRGVQCNGLGLLVSVVECGLANETGRLVLRTDPQWVADDQATRSSTTMGRSLSTRRCGVSTTGPSRPAWTAWTSSSST